MSAWPSDPKRKSHSPSSWKPSRLRILLRNPALYWSMSLLGAGVCAAAVSGLVPAAPVEGTVACESPFEGAGSRAATGLDSDEAALALPVSASTPRVTAGAGVIVVMHPDPFSAGADDGPSTAEARVLEADGEQLLVAVARADLIPVSAALSTGVVSVALAPG